MAYPRSLSHHETFWRDISGSLQERGYTLRARYQPNWTPSCPPGHESRRYEDAYEIQGDGSILDAKTKNGEIVILKKMKSSSSALDILRRFMYSNHNDPKNHVVPLLDDFDISDTGEEAKILVLPLLRRYDEPEFRTVGEVVDFVRQVFEGVAFMHKHGVAHGNLHAANVMMDPLPLLKTDFHPMYPDRTYDVAGKVQFHKYRTKYPVKYYFVGFGYAYAEGSVHVRDPSRRKNSHRAPELQSPLSAHPHDPFAVDVYQLGLILRELVDPFQNFEFMRDIIRDMTLENPSARPKMEKVNEVFNKVMQPDSLFESQLRARLKRKNESALGAMLRESLHSFRRLGLSDLPAMPNYRNANGMLNGHTT
ncbi:hypothetical protein K474DRAFT_62506 [Panus rudis PR-1116 ss-1]|nr:hypothetical protein K474DRAFT_62506 [Panus rudis PR-1116 ss-1]